MHLGHAFFFAIALATVSAAASDVTTPSSPPSHQDSTQVKTTPTNPPSFPDDVHVANGCHISTLAYLARFAAAFPNERAQAIVITPRSGRGPQKPHAIALVSWRGRWWGRDEYLGVFPLHLGTSAATTAGQLSARAQFAFEKREISLAERGPGAVLRQRSSQPTHDQRVSDVQTAAQLVPLPSQMYSIFSDGSEGPVLFFVPEPGWIAVYDPQHGTILAKLPASDPPKVVRTVARHFGYPIEGVVRPHTPVSQYGTSLAAGAPRYP